MEQRLITRHTIVWMVLSALTAALFWHGWQLVTGSIPVTSKVTMLTETKDGTVTKPAWVIDLPRPVSRSWDPFALPFFACLYASVYRRFGDDKDSREGLVFGLVVGLAFGLVFGLAGGLAFGLVFGLAGGLAFGLVFGLAGGLGYSIGFCLMLGLGWGFLPALTLLIAFWLPIFLVWFAIRGLGQAITKSWRQAEIGPAIHELVVDGKLV